MTKDELMDVKSAIVELQATCKRWDKIYNQKHKGNRCDGWETGYYEGRKATYATCQYQVERILVELLRLQPQLNKKKGKPNDRTR